MQDLFTRFNIPKIAVFLIILSYPFIGRSQTSFSGLESLFTTPEGYTTVFATVPPEIDGDISETAWEKAGWSDLFQDIEGGTKPAPAHSTRVKMLWDKSYLYIAAELQEPHIWGGLKNHDDIIYYDNDFEVFIDPDNNTHNYFEIEVNALNTVLDLFIPKPYRNNGGILMSWDAPGLRTKVKINGTLNNPTDTDKSWTVEMAIPFKALSLGNNTRIPREGDLWRVNFSRVQWETEIKAGKYVKKKDSQGKNLPEHNWVWSPQGVINMHYPERWGYLQFATSDNTSSFQLPVREKLKSYLWLVYYRQKDFYHKNRSYASSLAELGIAPETPFEGKWLKLEMKSTGTQFTATIRSDTGNPISINHEGFIQ
ncbi:hypothetical protein GZH53_01205 [Flavihumibacter sp. R14]|nr:hypothetical protein [Flavihumibacter soli]